MTGGDDWRGDDSRWATNDWANPRQDRRGLRKKLQATRDQVQQGWNSWAT
jgi:hypothetical protein